MIAAAAGTVAILTGAAHAASASPAPGSAARRATVLRVGGEVSYPAAYTSAQLARSFPQSRFTAKAGRKRFADTGIALDTLVDRAAPVYLTTLKNTKNEQLRVTVTVTGTRGHQVTFALGELLKNYGGHPAYLALSQDGKRIGGGPELVVPADRTTLRWIRDVTAVTIGISTVTATATGSTAGSGVLVIDGHRRVMLTPARIASLPGQTLHVRFSGPHGMERKTETGPSLLAVLRDAHVKMGRDTWITAVGDDNYAVVVTPDEQVTGGRELQLSRIQDGSRLRHPRLVPDGDFFGDRYVYGIVDLYVGSGPAN